MKDRYQCKEGRLVIEDVELGIHIDAPYDPRIIPDNFSKLPEMVIQKDEKGRVVSAFFEIEGKLDGQFLVYYMDGTLKSECYYKEGKLHGPSRFFSEEGECLSESWYFNGKKEGKIIRRFLSGKKESIQRYKKGLLQGKQEFYYRNGVCRTVMNYQEGVLDGNVILCWPSGLKKREVYFQKGRRCGFDQMWSIEGTLLYKREHKGQEFLSSNIDFLEDRSAAKEKNHER